MSKINSLLEALLGGEAITLKDSVNRWNLFALSQAVGKLKRKRGVPIETELVPLPDDEGNARNFGRYRIVPDLLAGERARFGK